MCISDECLLVLVLLVQGQYFKNPCEWFLVSGCPTPQTSSRTLDTVKDLITSGFKLHKHILALTYKHRLSIFYGSCYGS